MADRKPGRCSLCRVPPSPANHVLQRGRGRICERCARLAADFLTKQRREVEEASDPLDWLNELMELDA